MEPSQHGFLEEFLQAPKRDMTWTTLPAGVNDFFPNGWSFSSFEVNPTSTLPTPSSNPSFVEIFSSPKIVEPIPSFDYSFSHQTNFHFLDGFTVLPQVEMENSTSPLFQNTTQDHYPTQEDYPPLVDFGSFEDGNSAASTTHSCMVEIEQASNNVQVFNVTLCGEKKGSKSRKLEGQPSKNLMAERRRRKRLNDRLSMLRSIVPKISKMDRTSILGDTIDYMKELLERANKLQEENEERTKIISLMNSIKDLKPNEAIVRNSPKFHVERTDIDTQIDVCCSAKPGLLLSTLSTLEALGIEIQQCVISCFSDFSLQASCSEEKEQRTTIASEDIKQALFRSAGYGGRCL